MLLTHRLPIWGTISPLYQSDKSYDENFLAGPQFYEEIPERPVTPPELWVNVFGYELRSRIGVAAGPLLCSRWTSLAAKLGFDLVTYKTIRSRQHLSHPYPNVVCVEAGNDGVARFQKRAQVDPHSLSITNSFGMPSQAPEFLLKDISRASQELAKGQKLIVSIVGSGDTFSELLADYQRTAQLAVEAGATLLEVNASCPNVSSGTTLYADADLLEKLCRAIHKAVPTIPFIVKVGLYPDRATLRNSLLGAARGGAAAISGINSISMRTLDDDGSPLLGPARPTSGICGRAIHNQAIHFVRMAREEIDHLQLPLVLIGVGGAMTPDDLTALLEAGSDLVQSATGMMWDPYLALRYHLKAISKSALPEENLSEHYWTFD